MTTAPDASAPQATRPGPLSGLALGRALPPLVGLCGIAVTAALWAALAAEQDRRIHRQVQFEAAHAQRLLLDRLPHEVARVAELAEKWPDPTPGATPEPMRLDAGGYVGQTPGCLGVALVAPDLRVTWVEGRVPEPPSFAALGGGEALAAAVRAGHPAVARPPRSCWHGQRVLLVFAPHRANTPGGFVSAVAAQQFYATLVGSGVAPGTRSP